MFFPFKLSLFYMNYMNLWSNFQSYKSVKHDPSQLADPIAGRAKQYKYIFPGWPPIGIIDIDKQ